MWDRLKPTNNNAAAAALPIQVPRPVPASTAPDSRPRLEVTVTSGFGGTKEKGEIATTNKGIRRIRLKGSRDAITSTSARPQQKQQQKQAQHPRIPPQFITATTTVTQTVTRRPTKKLEDRRSKKSASLKRSRSRARAVKRSNTRRYEIRKGGAQRAYPGDRSDRAPVVRKPPPRNKHHYRDSHIDNTSTVDDINRPGSGSPLSPSSLYPEPDYSIYSPYLSTATVATYANHRSGVENVSPPSSPEPGPRHDPHPDDGDVSPIEATPPEMTQLEIAKAHHRRHMEEQERNRSQMQVVSQPPPQPQPQQQARSQIPMMRRERRQNQQSATSNMRQRSRDRLVNPQPATRWDNTTGESTTSATGRAGQVRPESFVQDHDSKSSTQASILSTQPPEKQSNRSAVQSFGDRVRKMKPGGGGGSSPAAASATRPNISAPITAPRSIDDRPGWRGASGRMTTVPPVADKTEVPPLVVPPKSNKRQSASSAAARGGAPMAPAARVASPISPVSSPETETPSAPAPENRSRQLAQSPVNRNQTAAQTYPSPPTSDDGPAAAQYDLDAAIRASPDQRDASQSATPNNNLPAVPDQEKAIRRKPPPSNPLASQPHHPPISSSAYPVHPTPATATQPPQQPQQPQQPAPQATPNPDDGWVQPGSRFSVTTYATSAVTGSTRNSVESSRPPVPPLHPNQQQPDSHPEPAGMDSVMDRGRPLRTGDDASTPASNMEDGPLKISMTPLRPTSPSSQSPSPTSRTHAHARLPSQQQAGPKPPRTRKDSTLSLSKALPPAPPELLSVNDRVAHLNARLESLANRRININTAIKQMTELMPTDNLLASEAVIRKRDAEKRKVDVLREELADVQREEYEIGIKLHRAYKRLDRNADFEPTSLWVRRVTG